MNTNYGGVVCKPAGNVQRQISRVSVEDSADDLHASAISEAERYAREQCADHPDEFTEGFAFKFGVERDAI